MDSEEGSTKWLRGTFSSADLDGYEVRKAASARVGVRDHVQI